MSLPDEVAALPGGGPVAAAMTVISTADPDGMRDLATRWQRAADQYTSTGTALSGVTDQLHGQWTGAAATEFTGYVGSLNTACGSLSHALTQVSAAMRQAATAIEGYQNWAATRCEWLLNEARSWTAANPTAGAAQRNAAIGALCQETQPDLRKVADSISGELTVLSGVFGQVSDQEKAFDGINAPSGVGISLSRAVISFPAQQAPDLKAAQVTAGTPAIPGTAATPAGTLSRPMTRRALSPLSAAIPARRAGRASAMMPATRSVMRRAAIPMQVESASPGGAPPGQINSWIQQALSVLAANGVDVSKISPADLYAIIQHESAGDPLAVNNFDANAALGHPSIGLMQTVDSTFEAYKLPGYDNVRNPVDNIIAGVRYALARYGSIAAVPGVVALRDGGAYVGY